MKKTIILIDGQNLHYVLKDLKIGEMNIHWNKLFSHFLESNDELIRTYWFRPQKILDSHLTSRYIKNKIIHRYFREYFKSYINRELTSIPNIIQDEIQLKCDEVENWLQDQKMRFSSVEYMCDRISLENFDIEVVKTGILKIDPISKVYIGENGIDIALSVKMISLSLEKRCDKIILVSGDYDYLEAIKYVKNNMTKVHIVKIHKGDPPKNKNMSRELSLMADKMIHIYESDLITQFVKNSSVV